MLVEIYDKLVPTLTVRVKDAFNDKVYATYSYPEDYNILYSKSKFYLEFEPAVTESIIEVDSPLETKIISVSARVEDGGQADGNQYYVEWSSVLDDGFLASYSDVTYLVYLKKRNEDYYFSGYTSTANTLVHVDFETYDAVTGYFLDSEGNPYFLGVDVQQITSGSALEDKYCLFNPDGYISATVSYNISGGFSFGCLYKNNITINFGALQLSIDSDNTMTFTATDGLRTYSISEMINVYGDWRSVLVSVDGSRVQIYARDVLVKTLDLIEDGTLENIDLSITTVKVSGFAVDEFFVSQEPIDYDDAVNFWIKDKPVFIGTTQAVNYMFDASLVPGAPSDYYIKVIGNSRRRDGIVNKSIEFDNIEIRRGTWCKVWDQFTVDFVSEFGVSFEVGWKDQVSKFHYPKYRVPINKNGYFAVYLPAGDIYTARFYDTRRTFRFCVPDTMQARMSTINGGEYVVE